MRRTLWAALSICLKDLRAEARSRELLGMMLLFALLSVLIFSFALELNAVARREAVSGVWWVTIVFASVLGLNRTMALEREQGNIDALLLAPIPRAAILIGKFLSAYLYALLVGLILLPVMTVIYNLPLVSLWVVVMLLVGAWGICMTGSLLAAMTVQARGGESLLPVALLPVALPILISVVQATTGIFEGSPRGDWSSWLPVLMAINVVYTAVCLAVFRFVVEE
ncbi:heme exporter protein CcmB [Aggregatilineales bacterium SYSU G02658]